MPASDVAVTVDGLSVSFRGRRVLDELSFTAEPRAITAVLGPNGAGKTTVIRCCAGLIRPDAGRITLLGAAPGSPEATARVGVMPQSTGAWSGIRAGELLHYLAGLYAHPHDPGALMARLGITDVARTPYRRLSGGQQQSVNLAGALIGRPELVFLDEPTAGLDPHARRATWELLSELRAAGVAVVLTTHAMDEAAALADQVYIVDRGQVAVSGSVPELTRLGGNLEDVFLSHTHSQSAR